MEDLKRFTWLVYFCVAGVIVSFGGGAYTAWKQHKSHEEMQKPENSVPVPATAQ